MASPIENRIAAHTARIAVLDSRIGRLMTKRVDEEDKLAELYRIRAEQKAGIQTRLQIADKS